LMTSPVSGRGIDSGLQDVDLVAEAVAAGDAPAPPAFDRDHLGSIHRPRSPPIAAPRTKSSLCRGSMRSHRALKNLAQKPTSPIISSHGPLSNPTTAVRSCSREPLFMAEQGRSARRRARTRLKKCSNESPRNERSGSRSWNWSASTCRPSRPTPVWLSGQRAVHRPILLPPTVTLPPVGGGVFPIQTKLPPIALLRICLWGCCLITLLHCQSRCCH